MTKETLKNQLNKIGKDDIKKLSIFSAIAFENYPVMKELFPNDKKRFNHVRLFSELIIKYVNLKGTVYLSSNRHEGFFLTLPYKYSVIPISTSIFLGGYKWPLVFGIKSFFKMLKINSEIEELLVKNAPKDCIYVFWVAVDPQHRSKNILLKLINQFRRQLNQLNCPVYCETFEEYLRDHYIKLGFKIMESKKIPNTKLTLYSLLMKNR